MREFLKAARDLISKFLWNQICVSLQADSVELMEFIINLEDEYQLEIPDKAIDDFNTVGDVVDYIEKRTASN